MEVFGERVVLLVRKRLKLLAVTQGLTNARVAASECDRMLCFLVNCCLPVRSNTQLTWWRIVRFVSSLAHPPWSMPQPVCRRLPKQTEHYFVKSIPSARHCLASVILF